jgi:hypothetical protein
MRKLVLMLILMTTSLYCCDKSVDIPIVEEIYWKELGCLNHSDYDSREDIAVNSNGDIFVCGWRTVYRKCTGGVWSCIFETAGGVPCCQLCDIFISSNDNLYIGEFRSVDNGDNWEWMNVRTCGSASIAENSQGQLFAVGYLYLYADTGAVAVDTNVCISDDYGDNWEPLSGSIDGTCIAINMQDHIFVCGGYNIWRSIDNGDTWEILKDDFEYPIKQIVTSGNEGIIVRGCEGNIYRSVDNGETWEDISCHVRGCGDIAINSSGHIYVTIDAGFLLCSTDNGKSWIKLGSGEYVIEEIAITHDDRVLTIIYGCLYQSIFPLEF